ncbi:acyltransferase family protein [Flavobacterium psychrophilum]|uniref:acyltransferase n=1 Tax=Flavobacterium psychrophilum TaxID=96345 RepID=UPI001C8F3072|nr:acyltransferase family protein [Flavobacterium psychrophilum]QZL00437.1 acyltransferase family protein [Flavobacterium psychrophilum]
MKISKTVPAHYGISLLRILATLSVIIIHVAAPLVMKFGKISNFDWNVANIYDSMSRYAVPVFFMISGALLLGRDSEIKDFLKNRLGKILPPFLFWSLFYSVTNRYVFTQETFSISKIIRDVFYGSKYHLWFVYALIGVYLITPIIQKWLKFSENKEILYFLIIWVITLFLTIPGIAIYFPKINLAYFSGYLGYFILGYYLKNYGMQRKLISYSLLFVGLAITILGSYYMTQKNGVFYDYFYEYLCINTLLVSMGIFLLFNTIETINDNLKPIISKLNECSFGIYLVHPLVLNIFGLLGIGGSFISPVIGILIVSLTCFLLSFFLIFSIKKIKFGHLIA